MEWVPPDQSVRIGPVVENFCHAGRLGSMQALKAVVKNGRLVLDEPTKQPEGTEVELLSIDDAIDPDERALILQAIEEGFADIERGDHVDAFEFLAQLRAKREAAHR